MVVSKRVRLIENIKSILLAVLFVFTILLLFFFWGGKSFQSLTGDEARTAEAISLKEIFQPDRLEVCSGGGPYAVTAEGFDVMAGCLSTLSANRNLSIEEVTADRYGEDMKPPSVKAVFEYYVPFSAICEIYGVDRIAGADSVGALSELGYSSAYDDRMYIHDSRSNKYFRIVGSSNSCFDALKEKIAEAEAGSATYYTLETYMGIANAALCPVSFESSIYNVPYYTDGYYGADKSVRGFFSDNFDFVRRIEEESGTAIYMYGYGRIVVIAHNDGTLEFKTEDDERPAAQLKYLEAFEKANAFIAAHGAFKTESGVPLIPYIKDVVTDPGGKKGFRFVFGVAVNGSRIYYQTGAPVIVDVIGGRGSYYKRDMISIKETALQNADNGPREAFSAINAAAANMEYIRGALEEARLIESDYVLNEALMESITRFDCGYVKPDGGSGTLQASWVVTAGGLVFYFGLDDGRPNGYSLK